MLKCVNICDTLWKPCWSHFFVICCYLQKIILHMVKNIMWKCSLYIFNNLYIFNIDCVVIMSKIEIIVKLMEEIKLWCLLSRNDFETSAWISQRGSHIYKVTLTYVNKCCKTYCWFNACYRLALSFKYLGHNYYYVIKLIILFSNDTSKVV